MKKSILFICLPSTLGVYQSSKISIAIPSIPLISLAQLSAVSREASYTPLVLDLSIRKKEPFQKRIIKAIKECNPEYCGITFTTTLSEEAESIAKLIKTLNPRIKIISGGPHSSIMPKEVLNGSFDIAVIGEGEITLKNILLQKPFKSIKGIAYKEKNKIKINPPQELIENLDSLPMPDYSVFNIKEYHTPRINCKKNPIAAIETSRGCVYNCIYCNNKVFGRCFRAKSAKRTVDEIEHILKFGFKEIHVWDDGFSTDLNRAKDICKEILKRKLKVTWNIYNGLRVDRIDRELLFLLKKSGCYRISLGVESGNQSILNRINKGTKVEDIKKAFKIANEVGIDTVAFCIIGLPDETEETMKQTIDLILEIKPTLAKVSILMPFPGTPIFEEWSKSGNIISTHWTDYVFHMPKKVYNHPNLKWETINEYYALFYRKVMLNPEFLFRRFIRGIKNGELLIDTYYFLKTIKYGWK
ncbi:radical SAM protein [Candidatus Pacearchaeota archaeon]|nr:radical SAM protein [Candidatus Pacearchaeota archaeon]